MGVGRRVPGLPASECEGCGDDRRVSESRASERKGGGRRVQGPAERMGGPGDDGGGKRVPGPQRASASPWWMTGVEKRVSRPLESERQALTDKGGARLRVRLKSEPGICRRSSSRTGVTNFSYSLSTSNVRLQVRTTHRSTTRCLLRCSPRWLRGEA